MCLTVSGVGALFHKMKYYGELYQITGCLQMRRDKILTGILTENSKNGKRLKKESDYDMLYKSY